MNMTTFSRLYDFIGDKDALSVDEMGVWASQRFDESVSTNPDFYYGPFTGSIARNAGFAFAILILLH